MLNKANCLIIICDAIYFVLNYSKFLKPAYFVWSIVDEKQTFIVKLFIYDVFSSWC